MKKRILAAIALALCMPVAMSIAGCAPASGNSDATENSDVGTTNQTESSSVPEEIPDNPDAAAGTTRAITDVIP